MKVSFSPRRTWPRWVTLSVFLAGPGCTLIANIEKREDDGSFAEYDTVDQETELPTTELCVEYCDEVMENCSGDDEVYKSRITCINTCNALPAGEEEEPIGNTVQCRLGRARAAASSPEEECAAAGPSGGDGACGSSCDAWCHLLESECPEDYAGIWDCPTACSTIPKSGGFNIDDNYYEDTIECRLIHLGAVGDEKQKSVHCGHGRYLPAETCVGDLEEEPTCSQYCDVIMINCETDPDDKAPSPQVYASRDECMAACEVFPVGKKTDKTENTLGCRIYHSKNSAGVPATHCPHGGPTGDGHCGVYDSDELGYTGNCESYCQLFAAACPDEFEDDGYDDIEACAKECFDDFEDDGAKNDTGYSLLNAKEEDTIQCRAFNAVKRLSGEDVSCEKIALSGSCD